jgi:hypothetical protein
MAHFSPCFVLVSPLFLHSFTSMTAAASSGPASQETMSRANQGDQSMNVAGQIAVTVAVLIGFGRMLLADKGDSNRLSGLLILAGFVGKVALSI